MSIHPMAVVDPSADLAEDVEIGPFTVIEADVQIGPGCVIESGCRLYRGTRLGSGNHLAHSVALGGLPQDLSFDPASDTQLEIGNDNSFREFCTVHRATTKDDGITRIGSNNYLMNNAHVGHDCQLGNHIILTSGAGLGGHSRIDDYAIFGGLAGCHQFTHVGARAMIAGAARVISDVPPYSLVEGHPARYRTVNGIGLKRAGFNPAERSAIKSAYALIYRSGRPRAEVLAELAMSSSAAVQQIAQFFLQSRRGVVASLG